MLKRIFAILLFSVAANAELKGITIGMSPGGDPQVIEKESFALAQKLQDKLGVPVQIYISKNYSGTIEALKSKKIDFAIMSSMIYVTAEKDVNLKVLLKKTWNHGPFYYSAIVAKRNSGITSVKSLKGKRIAFVDEKSTSGYLYPQVFLRKNGVEEKNFASVVFSGNHAASIDLLEAGKVDAAAVFADDEKAAFGAWTRFAKSKNFQVKVLWKSDPIPNDPIVVRQDFYDQNPKLTHELMFDLIEIQSEASTALSEVLGSSELMPATSRQYDPVREMVKSFQGSLKQ